MQNEFKQLSPSDCEAVHALEAAGYPADEAATKEQILFRLKQAPEYVRRLCNPL